MKNSIFREYDIRGVVGDELVLNDVYDLASAIAYYFKEQNSHVKKIAVGMDGRTHSPIIKDAVCRALQDSGIDVVFLGIVPSPVVYFSLHTLSVDGGLMITASHNPAEYNGIKICLGKDSVWGKEIQVIQGLYKQRKRVSHQPQGNFVSYDMVPEYIDWMHNHFKHLVGVDIPIVFDCGNSVAGVVMPALIKKMEWPSAQLLHEIIDGTFPNHPADPVVEKNMIDVKHLLQSTDLQVGVGFDGDADRMGVMTKEGFLVPGDMLLALFAQSIAQEHKNTAVVCNVLASRGLIEMLQKLNITTHMVSTGHSIVKEKMKEFGALVGGESSCHFFFKDRYYGYDDAIYAAMRLYELLATSGKSLTELIAAFPKKISSKEFRVSASDKERVAAVDAFKQYFGDREDVSMLTIDGVRVETPYGWGVIRLSHTQPVLSIRFESNDRVGFDRIKEEFIALLQQHIDDSALDELYSA